MTSSAFSVRRARGGPAPRRRKMQFGGLFGGQSGGQSSSNTQSTTTTDPGFGTPYIGLRNSILNYGTGLINQPYQPYDPSQRFAPFSQDQQNAQAGVRGVQGAWTPETEAAGANFNAASGAAGGVGGAGTGAFGTAQSGPTGTGAAAPWLNQASQSWTNPGVAQSWMNPFTQNVLNNTASTAMSNFMAPGGTWNTITDAFTGGGAAQFGRDRMGATTNNALLNFGQGLGNSLTSAASTGYNQGMQGFQNQQQLYGNLGATAGNLATGQMGAFTNLGSAQTNAAATGVNSNIAAGTAQAGLGQTIQNQAYRDINALNTSGQQQQQQQQNLADFNYQQNREGIQWPMQMAQAAQGLASGWQLPQNTTSQSYSNSYQQPQSGSIAGNLLGTGLSLASLATPGQSGTSAGGNILSGLGGLLGMGGSTVPGSGTQVARGGPIKRRSAFAAGGYAPVVRSLRQSAQQRQPAQMQRLAAFAQGQQGGGQGQMGAPPRAFARGGGVQSDDARDKRMITKAVHEHDRQMHGVKKTSQMTKLKLARGGRAAFAEGGDTADMLLDDMDYDGAFLRSHLPDQGWLYGMPGGPRSMNETSTTDPRSWGRRAFDSVANSVADVPAAFGRLAKDPARMQEMFYGLTPMAQYQSMVDSARRMRDRLLAGGGGNPMDDAIDTGLDLTDLGMGAFGVMPGKRSALRAFGR